MKKQTRDRVTDYARLVVSGERLACKWERLACQRHLDDLEAGLFFFDVAAAEKAIGIFPLFRHYKGKHAGKPFRLHPSQEFIVGSIHGWKLRDGGLRRFNFAYIEEPRKNGKTTLSAGIGLLGIIEEPGAEVYSVATKEDQAKIGWRDARAMIKKSKALSKRLTLRVKEIRWDDRESIWRPLGSDSETLDGLNPSTAIMDELHAWTNRELFDVIEDGMGAREQPLIFAITTAGSNHHGICMERRNLVISVLEKRVPADRIFGVIYTIDEGDDPHAPQSWRKANPLLGEAKLESYMQQQSDLVRATPGKLNTFLTKQLNVWVQQDIRWISLEDWDKCTGPSEIIDLTGLRCSAGLDLSSTTDITALVRHFNLPGGGAALVPTFWIPEDNMKERIRRDRIPYDVWVRQGLIRTTPGNVIDYDYIFSDIVAMHALSPFSAIAYDPWGATQIAVRLQAENIPVLSFRQGMVTMAPATKEFETRMLRRAFWHYGNPVLRWMAGNAATEEDAAGNKKPSKKKARERIDGIVAAVMAVGHDMTQARNEVAYKIEWA